MSTSTLMTAEQLFELSPDLMRADLIEGKLHEYPYYGCRDGLLAGEIAFRLAEFADANNLGRVGGSGGGFILQRNPDTVLTPAAVFLSTELLARTGIPTFFFPGPPDLAVEIVAPDDGSKDFQRNIKLWLAAGTKLVWLVDGNLRRATIYRPGRSPITLSEEECLAGEDIVPGFRCRLGSLFE